MEGGGVWPVGGVWSTGSAGAIGSDCRQVSAIRPNQEVCIYVSALPFSRGRKKTESGRDSRGQRARGKGAESLATTFVDPALHFCSLYDFLVVRF